MYCSKCGAAMANGAAFCSNCGQAFAVGRWDTEFLPKFFLMAAHWERGPLLQFTTR